MTQTQIKPKTMPPTNALSGTIQSGIG